MLVLLFTAIVLELCLYSRFLWRFRAWASIVVVALGCFVHGQLVIAYLGIGAWVLLFCQLFRILNLLRVGKGRMHQQYLQKTTRRTSLVLAGITIIGLGLLWAEQSYPQFFSLRNVLMTLAVLQVGTAVTLLITTFRRLSRMTPKGSLDGRPISELPTVTVAIPARNETESLGKLLDSVLASDYPKLEVLVYDDCSQDSTSDVIKAYAQAGVRFLHGQSPKENWVAKNQAYEQLLKAASGEWVLFCGADSRLGHQTISALVAHVSIVQKSMVSVLPRHVAGGVLDGFIQPLRYWWQLAVPRRIFNRPAALSTCWFIKQSTLNKLGGFGAVSQSVVPEAYFARRVAYDSDGYSFLRNAGALELVSEKPFFDQFDRALRVRYPEVHRRLELVMLIVLAEALLLIAPFGVLVFAIAYGWGTLTLLTASSAVLLTATNMMILSISSRQRLVPAIVNFPIISLVEMVIGLASMLAYEFGTIDWKGRNICLPAMHTQPKTRSSKHRHGKHASH
ncbi:MAG: glycosyltransferase [Candidatus Saccharibacteria bacterium]|nr:glycosyltransferase [Candidatus Saccharibacteria bacterium]